jgi:hypothetical protein
MKFFLYPSTTSWRCRKVTVRFHALSILILNETNGELHPLATSSPVLTINKAVQPPGKFLPGNPVVQTEVSQVTACDIVHKTVQSVCC